MSKDAERSSLGHIYITTYYMPQTEQLGSRSRFHLTTSQVQDGSDVPRGPGTSSIEFMLMLASVLYNAQQQHIPSATCELHSH